MKRRNRKTRERRSSGKRIAHRLYALLVILLAIAIITLSVLLLFRVQRIRISGNQYCTDREIQQMVQSDPYSVNSLYVLAKYFLGKGEKLPCLERVSVSLASPWTLDVTVKEKPITGYFMDGKEYVYFDREGLVVRRESEAIEGVTRIKGLEFKDAALYEKLKTGSDGFFQELLETTQEIGKYEDMKVKRIVCRDGQICLYIRKTCVNLGSTVSAEKIAQIEPIMKKIGKKKGTLHLENYSEDSSTITFEQDGVPKTAEKEDTDTDNEEDSEGNEEEIQEEN